MHRTAKPVARKREREQGMTTVTPASGAGARDTFPKLLQELMRTRPAEPAYREKE